MAIGIYGIQFESSYTPPIQALVNQLRAYTLDIRIHSSFAPFISSQISDVHDLPTFDALEDFPEMNMLISIGGDGTMLGTLNIVRDSGIPVMGLNTGRLGFLSLFNLEDPLSLANYIRGGGFDLDSRDLLEVSSDALDLGDFPLALNEITLHKKDTSSMITVHTYADDQFLNSYWADGLIVSTPTGSTAYSLSCGGPIVMPGSRNFILTPIAPHNLNVRPLVIPNSTVLTLKAEGRVASSLLTIDNRSYSLPVGAEVRVRRAGFDLNLVSGPDQHFFSTIRNKMMWGLDKRN